MKNKHTFAICAYKKSIYLEQCIISLLKQTIKSNIIITTSTPNNYIEELAHKYQIPVFVNQYKNGIGSDWNYALKNSKTDLVTLAHQDDIYHPHYVEYLQKSITPYEKTLIFFTGYRELQCNRILRYSKLLKTKKLFLLPLIKFNNSKLIRRIIFSFGTPICCPSVTLNKIELGDTVFDSNLKSNLDWDAWLKIAAKEGCFKYIPLDLVFHRIHENSETTNLINSNIRLQEDLNMLYKLWPSPIAKVLFTIYKDFFYAYNVAK